MDESYCLATGSVGNSETRKHPSLCVGPTLCSAPSELGGPRSPQVSTLPGSRQDLSFLLSGKAVITSPEKEAKGKLAMRRPGVTGKADHKLREG